MRKNTPARRAHSTMYASRCNGDVGLLSPTLRSDEAITLTLLTSIRDWNYFFFEQAACSLPYKPGSGQVLPPPPGAQQYDAESVTFSFRLVASLLRKGEAVLAGRLARKAFLDVETILHVEGPLVIWNILETVWSMQRRGQTLLPRMLLAHILALAQNRHSDQHPLLRILRSLHRILTRGASSGCEEWCLRAIQQGWAVNAAMLFAPLDERLLLLYFRIVWDSDLVKLPASTLVEADQFYGSLETKVPNGLEAATDLELMLNTPAGMETQEDNNASSGFYRLPDNYDSIVQESLSTIHLLNETAPKGTEAKFEALSALLKSRMLQDFGSPGVSGDGYVDAMDTSPPQPGLAVARLKARTLAFINRTIMRAEQRQGLTLPSTIDRLRTIIALRQFGQNPAGPQVVFEMWQLETLLVECGRDLEANEVRRESFQRLESYLGDIPAEYVSPGGVVSGGSCARPPAATHLPMSQPGWAW